MLVGFLRPDAGTMRYCLDGIDPGPTLPPEAMGYLPEDRGLFKDVPILRTLAFMGKLRGMTHPDARAEALRWLERLDLADRKDVKLDALSKGNQQKVQFIASIIHRPRVAFLDEPFSGLDPVNQEVFLDLLRELRDGGATIVLSAHQMQLVERIADRILLMKAGHCILHGTIDDIRRAGTKGNRIKLGLSSPIDVAALRNHPAVEGIEETNGNDVVIVLKAGRPLSTLLQSLGAHPEVVSVHSDAPTLHDIYLEHVGRDDGDGGAE
jgi:ABC-2 type transport system ATP-binding protein